MADALANADWCEQCGRSITHGHASGCPQSRPVMPRDYASYVRGWDAARLHFVQAIDAERQAQNARAVRLLGELSVTLRTHDQDAAADLIDGVTAIVRDGGLPG